MMSKAIVHVAGLSNVPEFFVHFGLIFDTSWFALISYGLDKQQVSPKVYWSDDDCAQKLC